MGTGRKGGERRERVFRQLPNDSRRRRVRAVLSLTDFSLHYGIPRRAIEQWIRIGRLNAANGLIVVRGRTYIDRKTFEAAFS